MAKQGKKVITQPSKSASFQNLDMEPTDFKGVPVRLDRNKASIVVSDEAGKTSNFHDIQGFIREDKQNEKIENYWGKLNTGSGKADIIDFLKNRRRYFPIDFFKLDQLFLASPSREVLLKVTNINNKKNVGLEWLSYDGRVINPAKNELYVVLPLQVYSEDNLYQEDKWTPNKKVDGMRYNINAEIVTAIIGADAVVERDPETGIAKADSAIKYSVFVGTTSAVQKGTQAYDGTTWRLESGGGATGSVELP
jgi:hypothetical protein